MKPMGQRLDKSLCSVNLRSKLVVASKWANAVSWRRVSIVIGWHVDGLDRSDRTFFGEVIRSCN